MTKPRSSWQKSKKYKVTVSNHDQNYEIGELYLLKRSYEGQIRELGVYVYLGFGQDSSVDHVKTGHKFLNIKENKIYCGNVPGNYFFQKLDHDND